MFKMLGLTHTWGLPSLLLHFLAFLLFLIFNHSDLLTTSQPHLHTLFLRKPSFFAFVCFLPLVSLGIMSPELGSSVRYCPWKQQPASVPHQEQGLWSPPGSAPGQPSDPGSHTYINESQFLGASIRPIERCWSQGHFLTNTPHANHISESPSQES